MKRKLDEFLLGIGAARLKIMIEKGINFSAVVPANKMEAEIGKLRPVLRMLENEGRVESLLPDWALELVAMYGVQGQEWLENQNVWLRQIIRGSNV